MVEHYIGITVGVHHYPSNFELENQGLDDEGILMWGLHPFVIFIGKRDFCVNLQLFRLKLMIWLPLGLVPKQEALNRLSN